MISMPRKVHEQAIRMAELRNVPTWTDAGLWLPPDARCVLATDSEAHYIACYENGEWCNAWTEEPIDSVITHWMELPPAPEC